MEDWRPEGVRVLERTNGTWAAPASERPNPLRRERWVDLGELYPGHQVLMRFNPSRQGSQKLPDDATEQDRIRAGLKLIVRDHRIVGDGGQPIGPWIDPDTDQPYPSPQADEFWDAIPNEVLAAMLAQIAADQKKATESIEKSSGLSTSALRDLAERSASPSGTSDES